MSHLDKIQALFRARARLEDHHKLAMAQIAESVNLQQAKLQIAELLTTNTELSIVLERIGYNLESDPKVPDEVKRWVVREIDQVLSSWQEAPLPTSPGQYLAFTYDDEAPHMVEVYRSESGNLVWEGRNLVPCVLDHNKIRFVSPTASTWTRAEISALRALRDVVLELLAWHIQEYRTRPGVGLRTEDRPVTWSGNERTLNEKAAFDDASRLLGLPESNADGVPQELQR